MANKADLEAQLSNIAKLKHPLHRRQADVEAIFIHSSLEAVNKELHKAAEEFSREQEMLESFASAGSGVSQAQPPQLIASNYEFANPELLNEGNNDIGGSQDTRYTRGESIESESEQYLHFGGSSVTSSEACASLIQGRDRGDSIYSYTSANNQDQAADVPVSPLKGDAPESPKQKNRSKRNNQRRKPKFPKASMYMDDESTQFYQCEDGQLVFLSRFNMTCLMSDFSPKVPDLESFPPSLSLQFWDRRKLLPLPDTVEGEIIEIESVNLTPELRKRWPFLAHLPLYTDIRFVELDLNNLLSMQTKKKFKADFEKRRKKRQSRKNAEKQEDRIARKKEEERIKNLKARMQRIDPNDEFFQVSPPEEEVDLSGEAFGPSLPSNASSAPVSIPAAARSNPIFSFSNVTQSGGAFPALNANPEANFPALGSSPPSRQRQPTSAAPTWGSPSRPNPAVASTAQLAATPGWGPPPATDKTTGGVTELQQQSMPGPKKKGKGKKVVLFSTSGQRGGTY